MVPLIRGVVDDDHSFRIPLRDDGNNSDRRHDDLV